jgi:uncharacterized protein YegP (UPF0339 family)
MIRHISALVAVIALSLSSVACVAENETSTEAAETNQDLAAQSAHFETFTGSDGRDYFRLVAANGELVLRSEGYESLESAKSGVAAMLEDGPDARNYAQHTATDGTFFFDVKARNGEIIATSENYASKTNAERGARTAQALIRIARENATTVVEK